MLIHNSPYTTESVRHKEDLDMTVLRVMASRHSAFYSPLLGAIAGGFLQEEGFEPVYAPLPPGQTVAQLLVAGEIDVAQSAVSSSWGPLEQGQQPPTVHFAQINERDGFLIAGRHPDSAFSWDKLLSGGFMFVHGGQPQAMLAYALHKQGVDLAQAQAVNAGTTANMMTAWRQGQGAYFHEQGPYPQQLEHEQVAHIVASVGEVLGPVAFSSLTATGVAPQAGGTALHAGLPEGARVGEHGICCRDRQGGAGVLPGCGPGCADADDRVLSTVGMLEPVGDDCTRHVRGGARCVPALASHHETAPV